MFNFPLTFPQLQNFLITKKPVSHKDLRDALDSLVLEKKVKIVGDGYCLKYADPVDVGVRKQDSLELIEKAKNLSRTLGGLPWIKFIGITGSVAAFNALEDDDIDIIIVTQRKRLWLTRGFTFLILKILGELRQHGAAKKKICPNILLDESSLGWSKKSRNIYVAHEVVMVYPILDKDETYLKFLGANSWVGKFFGNLNFLEIGEIPLQKISNNPLDILETLARKLQIGYMRPRQTKEITKDNIIHFNLEDHTNKFLSDFEKIKAKEAH